MNRIMCYYQEVDRLHAFHKITRVKRILSYMSPSRKMERKEDTEYHNWPWLKKSFNFIIPQTILLVWVGITISDPFLFNPWAGAMVSWVILTLLTSRVIKIFTLAKLFVFDSNSSSFSLARHISLTSTAWFAAGQPLVSIQKNVWKNYLVWFEGKKM